MITVQMRHCSGNEVFSGCYLHTTLEIIEIYVQAATVSIIIYLANLHRSLYRILYGTKWLLTC